VHPIRDGNGSDVTGFSPRSTIAQCPSRC
jgi:hypothetical protein